MNPMATSVFPDEVVSMSGMTIWVLQLHHSGRLPIWNGPLPDELAADAMIAEFNKLRTYSDEQLKEKGHGDEEIAVFKDVSTLIKYRANVTVEPIREKHVTYNKRQMGFQLPVS